MDSKQMTRDQIIKICEQCKSPAEAVAASKSIGWKEKG